VKREGVAGHSSLVGRGSRQTERYSEASDIHPPISAVRSKESPNPGLATDHGSARSTAQAHR